MIVKSSDNLRVDLNGHGMRPSDYAIEIAEEPNPTEFNTDPIVSWREIVGRVDSWTIAHGADPCEMVFCVYDPATTEAEHTFPALFRVPKNGELVLLSVRDPANLYGRVLFRGTVRAVHQRTSASGVEWVCTAISDVTRLNDLHVTFTANLRNDPLNPTPRFDTGGTLLQPQLLTIAQIIKNVLAFKDTFDSPQYFSYEDIQWPSMSGAQFISPVSLETHSRCGGYVPANIQFNDTPKGYAIQQLLELAGNYSFVYVPARDGKGILRIVEHNLACNRCGDEWPITWVTPTATSSINPLYSSGFTIEEDNSEWNTRETANVCRLTTAPIRWYSGHWMVPEIYTDTTEASGPPTGVGSNPETRNLVVFDSDEISAMQKRAVNPDGANYRFTFPKYTSDTRKLKVYPVGLPLFPDWNVHEDYLPAHVELGKVHVPPGTTIGDTTTPTEDSYQGIVEFMPYTLGDLIARSPAQSIFQHPDNLRAYQAWHTTDECPACNGTGLVDKVYENDENEPELEWQAVGPSGRRVVQAGEKPRQGERITYRVSNYIFDPNDFGANKPVGTLEPFNMASGYPLPWKNMCPYCRGVGMKPEFKIRNIESDLFAGRSNQVNAATAGINAAAGEVPADADFTQLGPETWQDTQNRLTLQESAWVVVEQPVIGETLPVFPSRNQSFKKLSLLTQTERKNKFNNPLTFTNLKKTLITKAGIEPTDERAKIVPDTWKCEAPFTTIVMNAPPYTLSSEMGRVIFQEPHFVWCRKQFTDYVRMEGNKHLLDKNNHGMLKARSPSRGQVMADRNWVGTGFWRPARVWMTFFYTRPGAYDYLFEDADGNAIESVNFEAITPDGDLAEYTSRCAVNDGRLVIEVQKVNPTEDEAGGTLFETGNRLLQTTITESDARIETSLEDFRKLTLPTLVDANAAAYETYKKNYTYGGDKLDYVYGRILKLERPSAGEKLVETDGYVDEDFAQSIIRPKMYRWRLRDDRSKLLAQCVRRLEGTNNIQVSGCIKVRGITQSLDEGLGYVDRPGYAKACVKRITYTVSDGLYAELELSREEARIGETLPKDEDLINLILKDRARLGRFIEQMQNQGSRSQPPMSGGELPPTTGSSLIRPQ